MKLLSPSLSNNSRALKATLGNSIASDEEQGPPSAGGGELGCAAEGCHLTAQTELVIRNSNTHITQGHTHRTPRASAFLPLLSPSGLVLRRSTSWQVNVRSDVPVGVRPGPTVPMALGLGTVT